MADIMRMDLLAIWACQGERHGAAPIHGLIWAKNSEARQLTQPAQPVRGDVALVCADLIHPDRAQVLGGGSQPYRLGNRRGARLEAMRRGGGGGAPPRDDLDHFSA